jgi:hypothetical protein
MRIGIIDATYDGAVLSQTDELCTALEELGHLVIYLDFFDKTFVVDLISSGIEVAHVVLNHENAINKKILRLLKVMQIPLLHKMYCYYHLSELLNLEMSSYEKVLSNQLSYYGEHRHSINIRGGN